MIEVVVLHWNKLAMTAACVASLRAVHAPCEFRILVVDNGSDAHDEAALRDACPSAETMRLPSNLGFARGMNAGVAKALADGAEYVWLLNNDTICDPDALDELLAPMMADPRVGAVGSMLRQNGAPLSDPPIRGMTHLRAPLWIPLPMPDGASAEDGDYICGASFLVRAETWREVGPLDAGFPFFFEDADWSFRVRKAGWKLAETAHPAIVHTGSASISELGRKRSAWYREGHVRFMRRHVRHPFAPAFFAFAWRLSTQVLAFKSADAAGTIEGWRNGWRSNMQLT